MKRESKVFMSCIIVLSLAWMMPGCVKQSTPHNLTDFYVGKDGELFMVTFSYTPRRDTCLYMSADEGNTWRSISAPRDIYRVASNGQKWFLLTRSKLFVSSDFGKIWLNISLPPLGLDRGRPLYYYDMVPDNKGNVYVCGGTRIYQLDASGKTNQTWEIAQPKRDKHLHSQEFLIRLFFTGENKGIVMGNPFTIYRFLPDEPILMDWGQGLPEREENHYGAYPFGYKENTFMVGAADRHLYIRKHSDTKWVKYQDNKLEPGNQWDIIRGISPVPWLEGHWLVARDRGVFLLKESGNSRLIREYNPAKQGYGLIGGIIAGPSAIFVPFIRSRPEAAYLRIRGDTSKIHVMPLPD